MEIYKNKKKKNEIHLAPLVCSSARPFECPLATKWNNHLTVGGILAKNKARDTPLIRKKRTCRSF